MKDIKVRDIGTRSAKVVDRIAIVSRHAKDTVDRANDTIQKFDSNNSPSEYAGDRIQHGMEHIAVEGEHLVVGTGKTAYRGSKRAIDKFQKKRKLKKAVMQPTKDAHNTIQKVGNGTQRTVKNTERSVKAAQRFAKAATKTAHKSTRFVAKGSHKAAQAAKASTKAAATAAKATAKAVVAATKAAIAATKSLVTAIAAGGWVAILIIVVIMLVALIVGYFGIFFSGENTNSTENLRSAITELNDEHDARLEMIQNTLYYDELIISGEVAPWEEVLSVYAVKAAFEDSKEVASFDNARKAILRQVFWDMNQIRYNVYSVSEIFTVTETDENRNVVETEITVTTTTLYIECTPISVTAIAQQYHLTAEQQELLSTLISENAAPLWDNFLIGI